MLWVRLWPRYARLIREIAGPHGITWYLVELEEPLPPGFDPLHTLPKRLHSTPIRYLLASPDAIVPPAGEQRDAIADALLMQTSATAILSVVTEPLSLPSSLSDEMLQGAEDCWPALCGGEFSGVK